MSKREIHAIDIGVSALVLHAVSIFKKLGWIDGQIGGINAEIRKVKPPDSLPGEEQRTVSITIKGIKPSIHIEALFLRFRDRGVGWECGACSFSLDGEFDPFPGRQFNFQLFQHPFFVLSDGGARGGSGNFRMFLEAELALFAGVDAK